MEYLCTEHRLDHCPSGSRKQICHIQPLQPFPREHQFWSSLPQTPPPSPGFIPTGPSHCSWFSCLVYSSSYPQSSLSRWSVIGLFVFWSLLMAAEGREQEEHAIIQRFRLFGCAFSLDGLIQSEYHHIKLGKRG